MDKKRRNVAFRASHWGFFSGTEPHSKHSIKLFGKDLYYLNLLRAATSDLTFLHENKCPNELKSGWITEYSSSSFTT
jgi:hypothetical protein